MAGQFKPIPKRIPLEFKYTDRKNRKPVTVRLPEALIERVKGIAEETGYDFTELLQYALDQFCQLEAKRSK